MPFLRLTRDRRGVENTFLMHADRPGERPRLLYWYRSAPGIVLGRAALDEEAIRAIEDQHPGIDFDWPAILALREVMIPEEEAAPRPPQQQARREKKPRGRDSDRDRGERSRGDQESIRRSSGETEGAKADLSEPEELRRIDSPSGDADGPKPEETAIGAESGLVDELAGREIASRLRARYAEVVARIDALDVDGEAREAWFKRAEALDPDAWDSPDAVLRGVSQADALFEKLKTDLP